MTDRLLMFVQFTVSVLAGCLMFWMLQDQVAPTIKYGGSIMVGVAAAKSFTYVANGLRYGFKSVKTVQF